MVIMRAPASALIAIIILFSANAVAGTQELGHGTHEIDISVGPNEDAAYLIPMKAGERLTVDLQAEGAPVDFYLTNRTAYDVYKASAWGQLDFHSFYYLDEYSRTGTGQISYTYDSLTENELVVLVDNTGHIGSDPAGTSTVTGTIIVQGNAWTPENIILTGALAILLISFMVMLRLPKKRP